MRYFTQYCPNKQWFEEQAELERNPQARLFDYTASSLFLKRGVSVGDNLYLVTVISGRLYLAGKMEIGEIVSLAEAAQRLAGECLFQVSDYLFARRVTPLDYMRDVSLPITARLLFFKEKRLATLMTTVNQRNQDFLLLNSFLTISRFHFYRCPLKRTSQK